jgi:hypothetical protein
MTTDQSANRTSGETEGVEQEPTEAAEHDATQKEQAAREGSPPINDPAKPDSQAEAGTGPAGMPNGEPGEGDSR